MRKLVVILICLYQRFFSFDTGVLRFFAGGAPVCRHNPSCSEYTRRAVERFGVFKGLGMGLKRVAGCRSTIGPIP